MYVDMQECEKKGGGNVNNETSDLEMVARSYFAVAQPNGTIP